MALVRRLLSLAQVGMVLVACRSTESPAPAPAASGPDAGALSRGVVLQAFGECALSVYSGFAPKAGALATATAAALGAPSDPAPLATARAAFGAAMDTWQEAEMMQFGPAAMAGARSPGAEDLRDSVYSWPNVAPCAIDQAIVAKGYEAADFGTKALVNQRGLGALEYLLFYDGKDNACAATIAINSGGSWAALSAEDLRARRLAYAKVVADDLVVKANALLAAWAPDQRNFLAELATAGHGSKTFSTEQLALNSVSDATFYVEDQVKDMKLGRPLGLSDCAKTTCPELFESLWAKRSKENVRANIIALKKLSVGCGEGGNGIAWDDLLTAVGAGDAAVKMASDIDAALAALDALGVQSFEEALVSNPDKLRAIHTATKVISDDLRTRFISVLDLELPRRIEGDND